MYTGLWKERFIYGKWVAASGAVYPFFNEQIHVVDTSPLRCQCEYYYLGVDFGTKNPTTGMLIGFTKDKRMIVLKEYFWSPDEQGGREKTTNEFANDLANFLSNNSIFNCKIVVDPSASTLILSLRNCFKTANTRVTIIKGDNEILEGIATINNLFEKNQILIDKSCKNHIREIQSYSWGNNEKPKKKSDHTLDAFRYCSNLLFPKKLLKIRHKTAIDNQGGKRW